MKRREFIVGAGALSLMCWRSVARAVGCPEYYAAHLRHVAKRVGELAKTCDDGFWFISDLHIKSNHRQSGMLIGELVKRTPIAKTLCGGDLVEAFGKGYPTDRDAVDFAIEKYRDIWVAPIRAAGGKLYTAKGNHDFTVCHSNDTPQDRLRGFTYDGVRAREIIVGDSTERDIVTDEENPEACYYYFDNESAKIRYIVADTTDTQSAGAVGWGVKGGMQERQLCWLAGKAFATTPPDYGIVVVHHIPVTTLVGTDGEAKLYAPFRTLMEAYQGRGKWTAGGGTYDFSMADGRILLDITGHKHCEMMTFQNGILYVTLPCDAAYTDYIERSKPWCGELPVKTRGTVAEQTFDAVQVDGRKGLVHFTRVGGGQDRTVSLKPRTVRSGEAISMAVSRLRGPIKWDCYDADKLVVNRQDGKSYKRTVTYHQTYAKIDGQGVLTGLSSGEVIVVAMDGKYNRELFPVRVYEGSRMM